MSTSKKNDPIDVPEAAIVEARRLYRERQQAEERMQVCLAMLVATLGVPESYHLDLEAGQFVPREESEFESEAAVESAGG